MTPTIFKTSRLKGIPLNDGVSADWDFPAGSGTFILIQGPERKTNQLSIMSKKLLFVCRQKS